MMPLLDYAYMPLVDCAQTVSWVDLPVDLSADLVADMLTEADFLADDSEADLLQHVEGAPDGGL